MEKTPAPSGRLQQLEKLLERTPTDPFLLYGIAMEHKKVGDTARALEHFERTLAADPGYLYAYFQRGQTYEALGDLDAARKAYREGVAAAKQKGDAHALSEIEGALEMIGE